MQIAESGEGESKVDELFMETIEKFDREQEIAYAAKVRDYEGRDAAWKAKRRGLERKLENAMKKSEGTKELELECPLRGSKIPRLQVKGNLLLVAFATSKRCEVTGLTVIVSTISRFILFGYLSIESGC